MNHNWVEKVYSSKSEDSTRAKMKGWRKTVGITLPTNLIERSRKQGLNISRITENALNSILDFLEQETGGSTETLGFGKWTERDLNPRLLHCECSVHTRLNYRP